MADIKPIVAGPYQFQQLQAGDYLVGNTPPAGDNSTKYATTAFVAAAGSGGGGILWSTSSVSSTLAANSAQIVTAAVNKTLPSSVSSGQQFIVHAKVDGVRIVSNGNVLTDVGSGNDLMLLAGETAYLVASSPSNLEIV